MKATDLRRAGALALGCVVMLAQAPTASAQQALTAQSVIDRAEIENLLTRYYWNFGGGAEAFGSFYAPDGEMVLGKNSYKGLAAIAGAYKAVPQDAPQRKSFSLNILMSNLLIDVHGTTATAQLVFTETVKDTQEAAPRILTQGREFDHLVKLKGRWLISKRQILGPADKPADWPK
jgi:hypothetical protein